MLTDAEIDLIERLFDDELNEKESKTVYDKIKNNNSFKEAVRQQLMILEELDRSNIQHLKNEINGAIPPLSKYPFIVPWKKIALAASLLLFTSLIVFLYLRENVPASGEELLSNYFEVYPINADSRGDGLEVVKGISLYGDGKYHEALPYIIKHGDPLDADNQTNLLIGSIYIKTNQWEKARIWFKPATRSDDVILKNYADWYTALSYLPTNITKAKSLFKIISVNPGPYRKEAEIILKEID